MEEEIREQLVKRYQEKEDMIGAELMRATESMIMLNVIDNQWKDHLLSMDHLKEGIGLRGYGQKDPLIEYKKESYIMFQDMMDRIEDETIRYLFFMQRAEAAPGPDETPRTSPTPSCGPRRRKATRTSPTSLPSRPATKPRSEGRAEFRDRSDAQHRAQESKRNWTSCNSSAARRPAPSNPCSAQKGRPQRSLPLRKRKEVQEMLRSVKQAPFLLLSAALPTAAIFPDQIGAFKKGPPKTVSVPDLTLYDEYGFEATEQAEYTSPEKHFLATAWRFHDSTGAMAILSRAGRPAPTPSTRRRWLSTSDGVIFVYGNYVFQFTGAVPRRPIWNMSTLSFRCWNTRRCPL